MLMFLISVYNKVPYCAIKGVESLTSSDCYEQSEFPLFLFLLSEKFLVFFIIFLLPF